MIRALVMVEPDHTDSFRIAADELSQSKAGLIVAKCEFDAGDPDAHWRWLAQGVIASTAMFEDGEPRFLNLGDGRGLSGPSNLSPAIDTRQIEQLPSIEWDVEQFATH